MAQRRMLNINLITSDGFSELQHSAQVLYFHLNMAADDDGLVGNTVKLMRSLKIQKRSLDVLVDNGYAIMFSSGVVAVTHWHWHNSLRKDRYTPTRYARELSRLRLNSEGKYELIDFAGETGIFGQPSDNRALPQCSVGKDSIDKDSIDKDSIGKCSVGECSEDKLNADEPFDEASGVEIEETINTYNNKTKQNTTDEFDFEEVECYNDNVKTLALGSVMRYMDIKSPYINSLTDKQRSKYKSFIYNLYVYLTVNMSKIDPLAFIKYNEERGWKGRGGESVISNYKKYISSWEQRDFTTKKEKPRI